MTADPHIETIRNRLDIVSCRCVHMHGMQMSGLCPVHGEDESDDEAYLALDALAARLEAAERDREALRDLDAFASNKAGYWQHPLTEKARRVLAEVAAQEGTT